ncbi:MAG: tetratricopeptide repeat protein [Candidatus Omnitrophota bacterium]
MKFSIGYNFDSRLLDLLETYKDNIDAFYFPVPQQHLGSGRRICEPADYAVQIQQIIKRCNALNISSQLLLNATCEGKDYLSRGSFRKLLNYVKKLKEMGLESVVITNPVHISSIKGRIKGIRIESSVNCYVRTLEHALYLKDLGVDVLTIDRDINRDIPLIKKIKNRTNLKIKLMLNEGCLRNCPFRVMHYNYLSHRNEIKEPMSDIFFDKFCIKIYLNNPEKVFSVPFIPPDALKYYEPFADYYKLSTRTLSTPQIEACLKAYINQRFSGDLLKILDCPGLAFFEFIDYGVLQKNDFFRKMISCTQDCNKCNYCESLLRKAAVIKEDFLKKKGKKEDRRAVRVYKNALKTSSERNAIYEGLSKAYMNLGEHGQALRLSRKVMRLSPKEITGYKLLGSYYEKIKRGDKAKRIYERALRIFPLEVSLYLGLSRSLFILKEFGESIKVLDKVIASNYKAAGVYSLLGFCYEGLRDYRKAVSAFEKEAKINPNNAQINFLISRCYKKSGQIGRANKECCAGIHKIKDLTKRILD